MALPLVDLCLLLLRRKFYHRSGCDHGLVSVSHESWPGPCWTFSVWIRAETILIFTRLVNHLHILRDFAFDTFICFFLEPALLIEIFAAFLDFFDG